MSLSSDLLSVAALALGTAPLGVMLMLRRLSLMSDALSHAVLPGVAIAILLGGVSATAMMLGAGTAAITLATLAALIARLVPVPEDASFAALYLPAFAIGVLILNATGHTAEIVHILFGETKILSNAQLPISASAAAVALLGLVVLYRPLLADGVDPQFLHRFGMAKWAEVLFTGLVAMVLVANFRAFGALMTAGMMVVPAASARLWSDRLPHMLFIAAGLGLLSGALGIAAHHTSGFALGPSVCASAGGVYLLSLLTGRAGGLLPRLLSKSHLSG